MRSNVMANSLAIHVDSLDCCRSDEGGLGGDYSFFTLPVGVGTSIHIGHGCTFPIDVLTRLSSRLPAAGMEIRVDVSWQGAGPSIVS